MTEKPLRIGAIFSIIRRTFKTTQIEEIMPTSERFKMPFFINLEHKKRGLSASFLY